MKKLLPRPRQSRRRRRSKNEKLPLLRHCECTNKEAMTEISFRLRRSRVWCNCGCPTHKPDCWIHSAREEILWSGADQYGSREELEWCNSIGGRVKKGHAF